MRADHAGPEGSRIAAESIREPALRRVGKARQGRGSHRRAKYTKREENARQGKGKAGASEMRHDRRVYAGTCVMYMWPDSHCDRVDTTDKRAAHVALATGAASRSPRGSSKHKRGASKSQSKPAEILGFDPRRFCNL